MGEPVPPEAAEDAAWVSVATPLSCAALAALLDDPERLLRVNPLWVFEEWRRADSDRFHLRIRTLANRAVWDTAGSIERFPDGVLLRYDEGLKASTRLRVEPDGAGCRLWIVDDYTRLPTEERERRRDEVDASLPQWGAALYRYLGAWKRWSRVPPWRWYMERVWRPMSPLGRRVVRLVFWVTVAEFALFLLLLAVLSVELTV